MMGERGGSVAGAAAGEKPTDMIATAMMCPDDDRGRNIGSGGLRGHGRWGGSNEGGGPPAR